MSSSYFGNTDWFADSPPDILELVHQDQDPLLSLENSRSGEPKGILSPGSTLAIPHSRLSPESPVSSCQDSSSDSASSKRTRSFASTKHAYSGGGDSIMSDGPDIKQEWNVDDYLHVDNDEVFRGEERTIDPKSIERALGGNPFDFHSASSSPSSGGVAAQGLTPPQAPDLHMDAHVDTSMPNAWTAANRGHAKAFSVSRPQFFPKNALSLTLGRSNIL